MAHGLSPWLDGYWRVEPDIPRVARGVKDRVNRLRALGNAVVPAQAYPLFRAIMEAGREK
jgi:DNA (cytosine-5)-methyltransferase 1